MDTTPQAHDLPLYHPDNPNDPTSYLVHELAHCPDPDDFYDQRTGPRCEQCNTLTPAPWW